MDHDQRFKTLLREFLPEFFQLFLPQFAERLDFGSVEWLDKEVFSDPPQGERRIVDLVARLKTLQAVGTPESWLALIHIEVESAETVVPLRRRMFDYYVSLRQRHELPVLPVALFLRVGLDGLGRDSYVEDFWGSEVVRFSYWYVGLPALDGEAHARGDNWLGVALSSLMRRVGEEKTKLQAQSMERLVKCPENEYRRYLLCDCLDAYRALDPEQEQQYQQLVATDYVEVKTMVTGWIEQGIEKGQRELLRKQLERRFGPLSTPAQERVRQLPAERLEEVALALLQAQSLRELGLED